MIGIVVRFDLVDPTAARRFDELTDDVVPAITAGEPGTLVYATQAVVGDPLARVFYEVYADDDALQAHEDAPHVQQFHALKAPLLRVPPRVEHVVLGAATGLPPG
ncbi:antibiotic biosynthesis monooxygenase [Actinotalea sp. BY-33]|uniref:Antibiotic biosynthesis monooxygenase n=1 Tax=Actinotalea soli TaxID=2819234 RepID=A0A939RTX8_9CELL|nr:antibiotic biosynthesis monooxygenase [Actinotalea soli]MBO1750640.1 antibiotic biosynthesis monooxygenase [Actinotalea soli]